MSIQRRVRLRLWTLLPLQLFLAPGVHAQAERNRPEPAVTTARNVVLFVADDHGLDTGAYGNRVIRTPHLDALAADGALFTHAFATTASCSASRSVILSGLHNHRTAQYGHEHDYGHFRSYDDLRTLPVLMREAGYRTASVGKFHVAPEAVYRFEQYIPGNERNPVEMAENTRSFLADRDDRPFFLYVATSDPHRGGGLMAGGADGEAAGSQIGGVNGFGNRPAGYEGIQPVVYSPSEVIVPPWLPDSPATRAELAQYYESVSRLDQGFGRLVQILKDTGVYDRTLIIYISDHGSAFPGAKTTVYEPGLRSPLIVRLPGDGPRGLRSQAMISWVDLTPTILDFAGVAPPLYQQHIHSPQVLAAGDFPKTHGLHGRSFLPILNGASSLGWDQITASHTFHEIQMYYPMRVVRDRKYKLIWNIAYPLDYPFSTDLWEAATWQTAYRQGMNTQYGARTVGQYIRRPEFELYDIENDPVESRNLAGDARFAAVLARYKEKLRAFQSDTSDPWALKWAYQ